VVGRLTLAGWGRGPASHLHTN